MIGLETCTITKGARRFVDGWDILNTLEQNWARKISSRSLPQDSTIMRKLFYVLSSHRMSKGHTTPVMLNSNRVVDKHTQTTPTKLSTGA